MRMPAIPFTLPGRERALGIARETRRYDLPMSTGPDAAFLAMLIALMTFLAMLALAASLTLAAMSDRWTAGIENSATVEIPAQSPQGALTSPDDMKKMTARAAALLQDAPGIRSARVMEEGEIMELVRPWLGDGRLPDGTPLPGLIALELENTDAKTVKILEERIRQAAPAARIDTHREWLESLTRLAAALQYAAALLTLVTGLTTAAAVAGAVRARMAVNRTEVELLHLMGATDAYISRQFQRHALRLALRGGLCGFLAGALALAAFGWMAGRMDAAMLSGFSLTPVRAALFAALPLIAALIAAFAARRTVLGTLARMP